MLAPELGGMQPLQASMTGSTQVCSGYTKPIDDVNFCDVDVVFSSIASKILITLA
jgi:hypothetical protein